MTRTMGVAFEPSDGHARIAEAYSLDAVDAAAAFGVSLDFSASSVEQVESILAKMHDEMTAALNRFRNGDEDNVWHYCQVIVRDCAR